MQIEEWRLVFGHPNYEISSLGRLRRGTRVLAQFKNPAGYFQTTIGLGQTRKVKKLAIHRAVALAFIPNPQNLPEVDHKFGNKEDNRATELQWNSSSGNQKRAYALKKRVFLNDNRKRLIRELATEGCTINGIARLFGMNPGSVHYYAKKPH